jgi:membrane-associated phospholipid phosphatase
MRYAIALLLTIRVCPAQTTDEDREVSWKKLIPNILEDQKRIWTFPVHIAKGNDLVRVALFSGVTAGLVFGADPPVAHYFRNTNDFHGFNQVFSSTNTTLATLAVPLAMYGTGLIRKDSKMTNTALLIGEAVADSEVVLEVLKPAVARVRPSDLPPNASFKDTWSEGGNRFSASHNSFPSGHAIAAFSVATVVSRRYGRQHRWVPIVAYGAAAAIGFSRLTLSAHYLSDVFVGGALGYSISRFAVLRQY